ncbi:MAG: PrsW family glutamic-type intramembrane protease [Acidobacteriota bacterium]
MSPLLRLERAIAHRDQRGILVNHMRAWLDRGRPALGLAGLAAALWLWFTGRLGRLGERPRAIRAAAIVAFFLGVVSSNVTLVLVIVEDKILGFTENGNPAVDLAYFVIGVGLREEVSKLLLFLPLVPILRRRGNRLDTLAIAAIVGLGFAADENLGYLEHGIGTTALARFLTANFAHMAMTGLVGISLYDALERRRPPETFSQTLALIVVLHGAYDFLLSNALVADVSFLSMTIFIILTRMFLSDVASVRRSDAGSPLLTAFGRAVACVTGASFVYAAALVGPLHAAQILALGLLGEAIMIYMFTLEFGKL